MVKKINANMSAAVLICKVVTTLETVKFCTDKTASYNKVA